MADSASKFKFNFNPKIECQVPGEQALREGEDYAANGDGALSQGDTVEIPGETFVPVLKVESLEATETHQTANPVYSMIRDDVISGPHPLRIGGKVRAEAIQIQDGSRPKEPKKTRTKIPVTRFRQTVEKIKDGQLAAGGGEPDIVDKVPTVRPQPRRSSIPKLQKQETKTKAKTIKVNKPEKPEASKKDLDTPKAEEEFEKIFDEIIEDKSIEYLDTIVLPETKIDPELETNFEEIIHAYDDEKLALDKWSDNRKSKIPLIKQKSLDESKVLKSIPRRNSLREPVKINLVNFEDNIPVKSAVLEKDVKEKELASVLNEQEAVSQSIDSNVENNYILRDKETISVSADDTKSMEYPEFKQNDWFKPIDLNKHPSNRKFERKPFRRDIKDTSKSDQVIYDAVKSEIRIGKDDDRNRGEKIGENDKKSNSKRPTSKNHHPAGEAEAPEKNESESDATEEPIPILKGNVSRLIRQISQVDSTERKNETESPVEDEEEEELPKPKSVLTKIAMFETIEPRPNPRTVLPLITKPAQQNQSPRIETVKYEVIDANIDRKPKIIEEVLKPLPLRRNSSDYKSNSQELENEALIKIQPEITKVENERAKIGPEKMNKIEKPKTDTEQLIVNYDLNKDSIKHRPEDKPTIVNHLESSENGYESMTVENQSPPNRSTTKPFYPNIKTTEDGELKSELHKVSNRLPETQNGAGDKPERRENLIENRLRRLKSSTDSENSKVDRSKSIVDIEIEKSVKGKVLHIIQNITSVETLPKRESINIKERPRKKSVSEKIALFERKLTPVSLEEVKRSVDRAPSQERSIKDEGSNANAILDDEALKSKIAELNGARAKYGNATAVPTMELRDGGKMPVIAVGTALLEPALTKAIIGAAIDLGYRAFDTAYIYGNEQLVGEAIRAKIDDGTVKREDLFIMSKLWSTFHRPDLVQGACRASLQATGLGYFDLYMIHNPMSFREGGDPIPTIAGVLQFSTHEYLDAWFPLEGLMMQGLVRAVGVANFNSEQVARIFGRAAHKPVVNQVECHPYLNQQRLAEFCANYDIRLSCYGTLGSKGTPAAFKSSGAASALEDPLVKEMAAGMRATPAQILIRYQLERGNAVVVKASTAAHLWDNLQALKVKLTLEQIETLDRLNKNRRNFNFKGMGDTHKNYPFKIPF